MDLFDFDNNRVSVTPTLTFIIIEYDNNNANKFISNQFAKFGLVLRKNKNRPKIVTY